jgi:hypothetical protein
MTTELLRFQLIVPDSPDGVAVEAIARVLTALQKLVHGLARQAMPSLRPTADFRRRYELRGLAVDGGAIAVSLGPRQLTFDLALGTSTNELRRQLQDWLSAVADWDAEALSALAPEPSTRKRLLRETAKLLPKGADAWTLRLAFAGPTLTLAASTARWVDEQLAELSPSGPLVMTLTGELVGVDFERGTFSLRYAPTGRILEGAYASTDEVLLLKSRRKLVHVSGEVVIDEEDHPVRLRRVMKVTVADLSPLTIAEVQADDGRAFALVPPLSLVPTMDAESQQLYEVEDEALELAVAAPTREELETAVRALIAEAAASPSKAWKRRFAPLVAVGD